MLIMFCRHREV